MSDHAVLKKEFVPKYLSVGGERFYRFLLTYALNKLILMREEGFDGTSPEIEFLEYYESFLILYRREGDNIYLEMSHAFRKAAHKMYRIMLKREMTNKNNKFLNLV